MGIVWQPERLTVDGYRDQIEIIAQQPEHATRLNEIAAEFPKIRLIMIRAAWLLSEGEPKDIVLRYVGITGLIFKQWLTLPDFKQLMLAIAPKESGSTETFLFDTKEQHKIYLGEMIRRCYVTIEASAQTGAENPMAAEGVLLARKKTVGANAEVEYYANPALRDMQRFLQMTGELDGLYKPKEAIVDDEDKGITQMTVKDLISGDPVKQNDP